MMFLAVTAASLILIAAERVLHRVRRDRARTELRHQIAVLCLLRSGKLKSLVFRLKILHFGRREEIQDSPAVAVLVVDNVTCSVLESVARFTSLRR